jgi:2-polyprenyl-3-methyl-5-hydroxy-6-metoxy-1,4-benzoquinol methylase
MGAHVTGVDVSAEAVGAARAHADAAAEPEVAARLSYRVSDVEDVARDEPSAYDAGAKRAAALLP